MSHRSGVRLLDLERGQYGLGGGGGRKHGRAGGGRGLGRGADWAGLGGPEQ